MKFILEMELGDDAATMINYARTAIAAVFLRSYQQSIGFVEDNGDTVGKWEVTDTPADPIERMYDEAFKDDDEKKFYTDLHGAMLEDICEQCGKNIRQCTCPE